MYIILLLLLLLNTVDSSRTPVCYQNRHLQHIKFAGRLSLYKTTNNATEVEDNENDLVKSFSYFDNDL